MRFAIVDEGLSESGTIFHDYNGAIAWAGLPPGVERWNTKSISADSTTSASLTLQMTPPISRTYASLPDFSKALVEFEFGSFLVVPDICCS